MAWTTPKVTFATGDVLTAADMNTYVGYNVSWLGADKPCFRYYRSANLSIPNATSTTVPWTHERFDVHSMHSTSVDPERVTVKSGGAGKYLFIFMTRFLKPATESGFERAVHVTETATNARICAVTVPPNAGTTGKAVSCSGVWDLDVGEYVQAYCYQDSGAALSIYGDTNWNNATEFMGVWLGT